MRSMRVRHKGDEEAKWRLWPWKCAHHSPGSPGSGERGEVGRSIKRDLRHASVHQRCSLGKHETVWMPLLWFVQHCQTQLTVSLCRLE